MRRHRTGVRARTQDRGAVSMLPVISLFVILVTFLVATATSVGVSSYRADVPEVGAGNGEGEDEAESFLLVVQVLPDAYVVRDSDADGLRAWIDRREPGATETLGSVLADVRGRRPGHRNVILVPDPVVTYEEVVEAADRARSVGLTHLSLAGAAPAPREP